MKIFIAMNSGIRLLLELISLLILVILGFSKFQLPVSVLIGLVLPTGLSILWAYFVAPGSSHRASELGRLLIEVLVFFSVFVLLKALKFDRLAYVYLAVSLLNDLFIHLLK